MGFLNHTTNNIIIDAVLTEKGRELLAKNDGTFQVQKFVLGDDEVDYSLIEQYGVPLGKEKIEKNTPIFEAITNQDLGIKYPLITLSNDTEKVFAYPNLEVVTPSSNLVTLSTSSLEQSSSNINAEVAVKTVIDQDTDFDLSKAQLIDDFFVVKVVNKLLKVSNPNGVINTGRNITSYRINSSALTETAEFKGQVKINFNVTASGVVTDSSYRYYSTNNDKTKIKTEILVIGNKTNALIKIPVEIKSV